jgi:hypothetical protein
MSNLAARGFQDPLMLSTGSVVRAWGAEVGARAAAAAPLTLETFLTTTRSA